MLRDEEESSRRSSAALQLLTVDPIIFDAIGVDPVRATDREQSVGGSVQRANETCAIVRL